MEETRNAPLRGEGLLHGDITGKVIGAFYEVFRVLRAGFLESTYSGALALEMSDRGIAYEREARLDVMYKGRVAGFYRPDFLVERCLVVELKASCSVGDVDKRQVIHYLRATNTEVGLLLHFGQQANFFRIVNERRKENRPGTLPT